MTRCVNRLIRLYATITQRNACSVAASDSEQHPSIPYSHLSSFIWFSASARFRKWGFSSSFLTNTMLTRGQQFTGPMPEVKMDGQQGILHWLKSIASATKPVFM